MRKTKIISFFFLISLFLTDCASVFSVEPTITPTITFSKTASVTVIPTNTPTSTRTATIKPTATAIPTDYCLDLGNAKGQKITIIHNYEGEMPFDDIPFDRYNHFILSGAEVTYDGVEITITYNGISYTEKSETGLVGLEQSNVDHVVYIRLPSPETDE